MSLYDVLTLEEFMTWFTKWAANGDRMQVEEFEDGEKIFRVYVSGNYLFASFSTKRGLKAFK